MKISDILRHKGTSAVATISPSGSVTEVLALLAEHNVGALVVVDGETVAGIVSERDIVRRLADRGSPVLESTVSDVMTNLVLSCEPNDTVDSVAVSMTEKRIRHMPVLEGGRLTGIVSIGDVVSSRMRQLEQDRGQLEQYITG